MIFKGSFQHKPRWFYMAYPHMQTARHRHCTLLNLAGCTGAEISRVCEPETYFLTVPTSRTWHLFLRSWEKVTWRKLFRNSFVVFTFLVYNKTFTEKTLSYSWKRTALFYHWAFSVPVPPQPGVSQVPCTATRVLTRYVGKLNRLITTLNITARVLVIDSNKLQGIFVIIKLCQGL